MNLFNIKNSYDQKVEKNWDTIFWMVDIHDTIIPGKYDIAQSFEFYEYAKEVLQFLSKQDDVCLLLYTCSHPSEISRMWGFFGCNDINFEYVNENPCVPDTELGNYKDKPYFNILLENKAGFEPSDWKSIKELLEDIYKMEIK